MIDVSFSTNICISVSSRYFIMEIAELNMQFLENKFTIHA